MATSDPTWGELAMEGMFGVFGLWVGRRGAGGLRRLAVGCRGWTVSRRVGSADAWWVVGQALGVGIRGERLGRVGLHWVWVVVGFVGKNNCR
jgi:hypothetical protein